LIFVNIEKDNKIKKNNFLIKKRSFFDGGWGRGDRSSLVA